MSTHQAQSVRTLPSGVWKLDPTQTTIAVTAKKLGLISVPGTLTMSAGTIEINGDHQVVSVEVIADAASYTTGNTKRDEHVRSADFLDVDRHPHLAFRTGDVASTPSGYRANGALTVKGETFPLNVDISSVEFDARSSSFVATATVDRTAIGVDKFPSFFVGRDLQLAVAAFASINEA